MGALAGEGALQEVGRVRAPPSSHLDALAPEAGDGPSYHGLPVLKRSVEPTGRDVAGVPAP